MKDSFLFFPNFSGIAVGRKGIGVAPAAKHVQCQGCVNALCSEFSIEKCFQFFICPHKPDGSDPDCSKRVHIINMSLGSLPYFEPILTAAVAAGIILVSVSGNYGPLCFRHTYPGSSLNVIATGSTDQSDDLSVFSGVGPIRPIFELNGRLKPDVVAPGSKVLSANYDTSQFNYILMDGTSMAAPHLAGLIALLLTRDKTLTQDQVLELIIRNTDQNLSHTYHDWCDSDRIPEGSFPNSLFGYGRINALKTINAQTALLAGRK